MSEAPKVKKIKLKTFDIKSMRRDRIAILIGSTGSGKSTLLEEIKYEHRDIPFWHVFAGTKDVESQWRAQLPDSFITSQANIHKIDEMLDHQDMRVQKYAHIPNCNTNLAIVLDDCGFDKKFFVHEVIRKWFMNGRHFDIMGLMAFQYCMDFPMQLRDQAGYIFVYYSPSFEVQKRYHKNFFGGVIPNFSDFQQILTQATENYGCLVLDNTQKKDLSFENVVYTYRANPNLPKFKLGCPLMWKYHEEHYTLDIETNGSQQNIMSKKVELSTTSRGKNASIIRLEPDIKIEQQPMVTNNQQQIPLPYQQQQQQPPQPILYQPPNYQPYQTFSAYPHQPYFGAGPVSQYSFPAIFTPQQPFDSTVVQPPPPQIYPNADYVSYLQQQQQPLYL